MSRALRTAPVALLLTLAAVVGPVSVGPSAGVAHAAPGPSAPASAATPSSATPSAATPSAATPSAATPSAAGARARAEAARAAAREAAARVVDVRAALTAQQDAVADAAGSSVRAHGRARDAEHRSTAARTAGTLRVRSLYMDAGGAFARSRDVTVLRSLVDGSDPGDALRTRDLALGSAARADRRTLSAASAGAARAALDSSAADAAAGSALDALRELAVRSDALEQAVAAAEAQVTELDATAGRLQAAEDAAREVARARAAATALSASAGGATAGVRARSVPVDYAVLYRDAALTCPGLRPALLAAVGQVESGHGVNTGPSSAGALGPMQFMPATFAAYGVDGDGDGTTDVRDPADAVFSAARYLCANGGGRGRDGERGALFRYNHADWYVAMVQRVADEMDGASPAGSPTAAATGSPTAAATGSPTAG